MNEGEYHPIGLYFIRFAYIYLTLLGIISFIFPLGDLAPGTRRSRALRGVGALQIVADQVFGDLHGVEGGPFSQVVGDHP